LTEDAVVEEKIGLPEFCKKAQARCRVVRRVGAFALRHFRTSMFSAMYSFGYESGMLRICVASDICSIGYASHKTGVIFRTNVVSEMQCGFPDKRGIGNEQFRSLLTFKSKKQQNKAKIRTEMSITSKKTSFFNRIDR
jgi:hypothetical protein